MANHDPDEISTPWSLLGHRISCSRDDMDLHTKIVKFTVKDDMSVMLKDTAVYYLPWSTWEGKKKILNDDSLAAQVHRLS
jgi:hypothetical protein